MLTDLTFYARNKWMAEKPGILAATFRKREGQLLKPIKMSNIVSDNSSTMIYPRKVFIFKPAS